MPVSPTVITLLDDMCRADLENFRDWYASCIFWSTLAVVIGCAMEVPEVLHELWPKLFAQKRERLIKIVASIGLGFVVLGVAGELSFEHWRAGYEGLLQNFDNVLLVDAELHAALAQREANDAAKEAGKLGVKVDKLPSFVAQKEGEINGDIAQFQEYTNRIQEQSSDTAERLKSDTAALNKASEDAKAAPKQAEIEVAAMQAANAPRDLLPQQQADFVNGLKSFGGLSAQILVPPSTTPDAGPLASLLESLLKERVGWNIGTMQTLAGWSKYVLVCIGKTPKSNVQAAATTIVLALRAANIQAFINNDMGPNVPAAGTGKQIPNPDMTIIVGSKL